MKRIWLLSDGHPNKETEAILPLVNKEGMPEIAMKLYRELKRDFNVFYDDKGAVGRRYRRQDEAGTRGPVRRT